MNYYAGYAGWGPNQLELELLQGSWHVLRASPGAVFDKAPDLVWPELIESAEGNWVLQHDDPLAYGRLVRLPISARPR